MHICFAIPEYLPNPGGIATYYSRLAPLLLKDGHIVTILHIGYDEPVREPRGIQIVDLRKSRRNRERQLFRLLTETYHLPVFAMASGLAMRDWLRANAKKEGIDIVEGADFLGMSALLLDDDLPPHLLTCHGSYGQICHYTGKKLVQEEDQIVASLELVSLSNADGVIAYSPSNADCWSDYMGRTVSMTRAPWTSSSAVDAEFEKSGGGAEMVNGLVIGRFQIWKGAIVLLDALNHYPKETSGVLINWIGGECEHPETGEPLSEFARKRYPEIWGKRFFYESQINRKEVQKRQAKADFVVVPSTWDTFSFAALEAMDLGKPLIISNAVGASYLCENEQNALLFQSGDTAGLANALQMFRKNPVKAYEMGCNLRTKVVSEFTSEKILEDRRSSYKCAQMQKMTRTSNAFHASILNPILNPIIRVAEQFDKLDTRDLQKWPGKMLLKDLLRRMRSRWLR